MARASLYRQTGVVLASGSSVVVTLDHAFPDVNYAVSVDPPYQTSFWITSKSGTGFTLNVGTTSAYNQTFGFIILHE